VNVFIVSAFGGQKPQFWANFDIWGSRANPLYRWGQIWCARAEQGLQVHAKCRLLL